MTATPGQRGGGELAYDAYRKAAQNGIDEYWGWFTLTDQQRADWEAAAAAAAASVTAERDQLREQVAFLQADLAAAEAEIAKWPRCPAGCRCRIDSDDADALECGCDGPCTTGWDDTVRAQLEGILASFHATGSGEVARMTAVQLNRAYRAAYIPVPDRLSHLGNQ